MLQPIRRSQLRKIGKIPDLSRLPEARRPIEEPLAAQPRGDVLWAPKEDVLEKAAIRSDIGTLPERIVWKWLLDQDHLFTYQLAELGGRDVVGGAVIDFVLYSFGQKVTIIRVQGEYWHGPTFPQRQRRDDEQYYRLHAMGYAVCDLWENDIYDAVREKRLTSYIEGELFACQ